MRKYDFDRYREENLTAFILNRATSSSHRTIRRKPRPPEEWSVFFLLTKARWERWQKEGLIKKTGPGKYSLKLF
ncbi:MAG TPA: hypothetical protein PKW42_00740 [bacterium]|nr:hypothetical protein [bacterium]HPP11237.1 hypothetical protein [bacterium]